MSNLHHACDCLVLRNPPPTPWRRPAILNAVVLLLEAFREALEMRRAAHQKYPFREE